MTKLYLIKNIFNYKILQILKKQEIFDFLAYSIDYYTIQVLSEKFPHIKRFYKTEEIIKNLKSFDIIDLYTNTDKTQEVYIINENRSGGSIRTVTRNNLLSWKEFYNYNPNIDRVVFMPNTPVYNLFNF